MASPRTIWPFSTRGFLRPLQQTIPGLLLCWWQRSKSGSRYSQVLIKASTCAHLVIVPSANTCGQSIEDGRPSPRSISTAVREILKTVNTVVLSNWMEGQIAQSCPTLCDPMDCSPPGFSVHGISLQGIFLTQGWNLHLLHLLHWQTDFLPTEPPGKPHYWNNLQHLGKKIDF